MIVGLPKEVKDNESRVGMVPAGVKALTNAGHTVLVQASAGEGSGVTNEEYVNAGAEIVATAEEAWSRSARADHRQAQELCGREQQARPGFRAPPAQEVEQSGGELAPADSGSREGDAPLQVGTAAAAVRVDARPGGQPVHAMPPHPEGARQTRGARPGLCGLGKGELRAHDGLSGCVRLHADPCHEVTRPESNKLTVPLRWKSVVTVGDRLVGDGVGDCWLHASAFSPSPAADPRYSPTTAPTTAKPTEVCSEENIHDSADGQ